MDLKKMFATQAELDARIEREHPPTETENRLMDTCLALLVELGECANEQRTFKYWSHDREPRKEKLIECELCGGSGRGLGGYCGNCHGGYIGVDNPLLEEYADVLHFTLSIGNQIGFLNFVKRPLEPQEYLGKLSVNWDASESFGYLFLKVSQFMWLAQKDSDLKFEYLSLLKNIFALGKWMGFSVEEIEKAYYAKNAINHNRQESGY